MLDVCLLGCGGMLLLPERRLSALLVRHKGELVLIDCGEGTQLSIKQAGWGFKHIGLICLTHYHADHVAGLPGFLLTIANSNRTEPLYIAGPPGLEAIIKGLLVIAPELPYELRLVELNFDSQTDMSFGDIVISSLPVEHRLPCLAYRIELKRAGKFNKEKAQDLGIPVRFWHRLQSGESIAHEGNSYTPDMVLEEPRKGIKLVYCTDTRPAPTLVEFCKTAQLVILEGIYADEDKLDSAVEKKHMLFSEAAAIAKQAGARELWLTHFSPSLKTPEDYLNTASDIFPNTKIGKDLFKQTLVFEEA